MLVNHWREIVAMWLGVPYPIVTTNWIYSTQYRLKIIQKVAKKKLKHLIVPISTISEIKKWNIIQTQVYVEISRLKSKWDLKTRRVEKKGSGRRIKRFKSKLGSQNFSCLTKSPEKPRAIHRGSSIQKLSRPYLIQSKLTQKTLWLLR